MYIRTGGSKVENHGYKYKGATNRLYVPQVFDSRYAGCFPRGCGRESKKRMRGIITEFKGFGDC